MDTFTAIAQSRAERLQKKIADFSHAASVRYIFNPIFPMIVQPIQTTIEPGRITPISEIGQPVGTVYLQTLLKDDETLDREFYNIKGEVGEITINPAPITDELLSMYGEQGCVQIKSLFNLGVDEFISYDLNTLIFGADKYETAGAYLERFELVRQTPAARSFAQLLHRVLAELEASVNAAFAWAKTKSETHNELLRQGELKKFSPYERRLFKFSGVTPIDEALNQIARDQAALSNALPAILEGNKPDWKEIGSVFAAGVKEALADVKESVIAAVRPAAAKEESPQPTAPTKGGKKA